MVASRCTAVKSDVLSFPGRRPCVCVGPLMVLGCIVCSAVHKQDVWRAKCRRGYWLSSQTSLPLYAWALNWHCWLHKGTELSGKASVETAGSRPLVVSTLSRFSTHTGAHGSDASYPSLSVNKQGNVSELLGKHSMCTGWDFTAL